MEKDRQRTSSFKKNDVNDYCLKIKPHKKLFRHPSPRPSQLPEEEPVKSQSVLSAQQSYLSLAREGVQNYKEGSIKYNVN